MRLNVERLGDITERVRAEIASLEREIFALADEEFLISSPQQLGEVLFEKLGLSRKRRGKTGFSTDARVLQAIRSEHAIVPSRALARALDTDQDLPRCAARDGRRPARASTRRSCRRSPRPGGFRAPTRTCRTCPSARRWGARSGAASRPQEGSVLISADYSQIELRVLAHAAERAGAEGDLRARRGRSQRDRLAGLRRTGRARSTRGCARRRR